MSIPEGWCVMVQKDDGPFEIQKVGGGEIVYENWNDAADAQDTLRKLGVVSKIVPFMKRIQT